MVQGDGYRPGRRPEPSAALASLNQLLIKEGRGLLRGLARQRRVDRSRSTERFSIASDNPGGSINENINVNP